MEGDVLANMLPKLSSIASKNPEFQTTDSMDTEVRDLIKGRKTMEIIRDNLASREVQDNYTILLNKREKNLREKEHKN